MKKIIGLVIIFTLLIPFPVQVFANDAGFEGGIANEQEYKEVLFITGQPIIFSGVLKINQSVRGDTTTTTYRYDLTSESGDKLTRSLTFVTQETKNLNTTKRLARLLLRHILKT